ncbi:MAG: valine--tRNA ligase [Candidatus Acidiferrales bacterium]
MAQEIPKAYEPQNIEARWAQSWFERKIFRAEARPGDAIFSIALPPPNVTGSIHIGHMLEHTEIDILARWHRMKGERTLWLPGIDHAGIATQFVVERELAKAGLTRQQLGREEFERRVWEWKARSGDTIKKQMIRLGASCDWTREKFTLEPALYRAVLEAFLRLFADGLIYRGRYMVNWCPRCQTAISDLEVVHVERAGHLWHIRYPIAGTKEFLVVATTRPETMLGDTAIAVHPDDERYKRLIGKKAVLPLMNREIPVIADSYVDREFGTGALKITPAHDPNDFEVAQRHALPEVDVMTDDGHMNAAAGKYAGLERFAAREKIVEDLKSSGLLEKVTNHAHAVGICDRCKSNVEPRVSTQWFCKMKPLAAPALEVVHKGVIEVTPDNQRTILIYWLENIRDWCISRQLWWGHRIPIWHCGACGAMTPARDSRVEVVNGRAQAASPPEKCGKCGGANLRQDSDVLDTWFSSALWPFSTLGWPDETADLKTFYPTSLLTSGTEILFFWDARMIMMGLHLMGREKIEERIPFRKLYLHAIVRDPQGVKMSKTRGNVVDPLEVTEKYGTDALRFTLVSMAAPGTDILLSEDKILSSRAFANKIWNAARFLFINLEKFEASGAKIENLAAPAIRARAPYANGREIVLADRWIFSRLHRVIEEIDEALAVFHFHRASHAVYHFFWDEFCDWYIEWVKPRLASEDSAATAAWRNLFAVFESALRLLHPFMPFLTEELWRKLPQEKNAISIALAQFPLPHPEWRDAEAERETGLLQEIIIAARNIRADLKVDQKRKVPLYFFASDAATGRLVRDNTDVIARLATLSEIRIAPRSDFPADATLRSTAQFDIAIAHEETVDRAAELTRLKKETERLAKDIETKQVRLADQTFRSRAPAEIVRGLESTLAERRVEHQKLLDRLAQLAG